MERCRVRRSYSIRPLLQAGELLRGIVRRSRQHGKLNFAERGVPKSAAESEPHGRGLKAGGIGASYCRFRVEFALIPSMTNSPIAALTSALLAMPVGIIQS